MTLAEELQIAYRLVKEAMATIKVDNLAEYDMLLAAGFRSAWASAWQRSRQVRTAPTVEASNTTVTSSLAVGVGLGNEPSEAVVPNQAYSGTTSGARGVVLGLLSTHALTTRQYKKLCEVLNVPPGRSPVREELERLLERQALEVLVA